MKPTTMSSKKPNIQRCRICYSIGIFFVLTIFTSSYSSAQSKTKRTLYEKYIAIPDSLHKKRFKSVSAGTGILWGGSLFFLNEIWYKQYPKSSFHLYNDIGEWEHVDKVGHTYSAYLGSKLFTSFFRWTGLNEKRSVLYGAGGGFAYQGIIEILDGYSDKWGFSLSDIGANALGCGLYAGQQLLWHDQRIVFKYSTHRMQYSDPMLLKRVNNLYGSSTPERVFKDYNAQTYWLSANLKSFAPQSKLPAWLNIAVGYGAQNMYGGYENKWTDEVTLQSYDRSELTRYRQFYISPDIDFSKIKWRSKFMRDFCKIINLKAPLPSIELNTLGKVKVHALHF
jgi:hypothetical protein